MSTAPRILNVDDNSPARFLKSRILERAGFQVIEAETAADAIDRATRNNPRLVLLDLRLPDGDGFQVCETLKAQQPELPIVMITSTYCTTQGRQDGLAAGADAYLLEPIAPERLVSIVSKFVRGLPDAPAAQEAWIVTNEAGVILEISAEGHRLLNLSARGAIGRNLLAFFAQERHKIIADIARALDDAIVQRDATLRPRDRRPFQVQFEIVRETTRDRRDRRLRWVLEPIRSDLN
jgi:DNA-binding response OmpR family regulator